ncbi:MAG: hypothetical protein ACT4O1_01145 [Gemmatimonadota bacterium]
MTRLEKWLVWGSTVAVTVTGTALGVMKYMMAPTDTFAVVNHPLQPLVLKLHIITAPFLIFGIGMITMRHIWPHFRSGWKRGRKSGVSSALLAMPMIGTGYAIQALTSSRWLALIGYLHFALGLVFAIGAAIHFVKTRRRDTREHLGPGYPAPSVTLKTSLARARTS